VRLRTQLVVLALVPLLGLLTVTAALVVAQARTEQATHRALGAVVVAGDVSAARSAFAREVLLSFALARLADPEARERLGAEVVTALEAEVDGAGLATARRRTDAALAAVPATSTAAAATTDVAADLRPLRTALDVTGDWPVVSPGFESLTQQLAGAERRAVDEASDRGLDAAVATALVETRTASEAVALGSGETLTVLDDILRGDARPLERTDFGAWASTAPLEVLGTSSSARIRVRSVDLLQSTTGLRATADAVVEALGTRPDDPRLGLQVRDLVTRLVGREAALTALAATASAQAREMTRTETAAARRDVAVLAAGGVLLCLLTGAAVLRTSVALGRPLHELAAAAQQVSRGELVSVEVNGPREVRTVADGLAATVASLRRLQDQARAVVAGELDSPVLAQPLPGPLGAVVHASVTELVQAMVDRDRLREDLTHRATHDSLTELPNRSFAMDLLDRALERSRCDGGVVGVLFVDLDRFKQVNDTAGHAAGDEVLRAVSSRMREHVRPCDAVCRLGGDEFLVVVEDADDRELLELAELLVAVASAPVPLATGGVAVGASVGVARTRAGVTDREGLLAEADAAAYQAKQAGRGGVGFFDDELRRRLTGVRDLEAALGLALRRREMVLHYQAVVGVEGLEVAGYEALVRWQRPGHGLLPPSAFVEVAERSSLVCDLGRYVLHEATRQLVRWSAAGGAAARRTVAVNVSGRHLLSPQVVDDVRDALAASGLEPHRLTVEITETVLVDHATAHERLAAVRALGVRVAIDDFGTGFTSIAQLQRLPADVLKIDRSLAGSDDPASQELVRLVVGAAHTFSLAVVAEGVETPGQLAALAAASCDAVQGYLLHRPCPPTTEAPELGARPPAGPARVGPPRPRRAELPGAPAASRSGR